MDDPVKIEDFEKISPLVRGYELKPGVTYLIIADGKNFSHAGVQALMKDLREHHPELNICIVASLHPKDIEVAEKKSTDD